MARVIAVVNQKGGVAKTTTVANLGAGIVKRGFKTMAIDLDHQGDLTKALGYMYPDQIVYTIADVMNQAAHGQEIDPKKGVLITSENIHLLPGNEQLQALEIWLTKVCGNKLLLKTYVDAVRPEFDFILIDCSPSLGILTQNALVAADEVIIPMDPLFFESQSLQTILRNMYRIRRNYNSNLGVGGILFVRKNNSIKFKKEIVESIRKRYGKHRIVFQTELPTSVRASEAAAKGKSLVGYQKWNHLAKAYMELVDEVIANGQ